MASCCSANTIKVYGIEMRIEIGKTYKLSPKENGCFCTTETYARDAEIVVLESVWQTGSIEVTPQTEDEIALMNLISTGDSNCDLDPDAVFEEWENMSCFESVKRSSVSEVFLTEGWWEEDNRKHVTSLYEASGNMVMFDLEENGYELSGNECLLTGTLNVVEV